MEKSQDGRNPDPEANDKEPKFSLRETELIELIKQLHSDHLGISGFVLLCFK